MYKGVLVTDIKRRKLMSLQKPATWKKRPQNDRIQQPKNWPKEVNYTPQPLETGTANLGSISQSLADLRHPESNQTIINLPQGPVPHVRIEPITNSKHPACGQHGLFALKNLAPDSFILLYCGELHSADDPREDSNYDLSLDRDKGIGIDASGVGNEARFINDYRGVRDLGPNGEFRDVWVDLGDGQAMKGIGIFVLSPGKGKDSARVRGIRKGEEILVSYGKGFWSHCREDDG